MKLIAPTAMLSAATFLVSACSNDSTPSPAQEPVSAATSETPVEAPAVAPPVVTKEAPAVPTVSAPPLTDDQRAAALWQKIKAYKSWSSPEGFAGLVESDTVHGDYVRFYANGTALADTKNLPHGSIIVKEGFHDDEGDLKAITVMQKIDGFSEESGDWFFSRFDSNGKASKVNSNSCIRCHNKADDGDLTYIND